MLIQSPLKLWGARKRETVRSSETQADLGSEVIQTQKAELPLPPAAQTVIVVAAQEHGSRRETGRGRRGGGRQKDT